MAKHRWQSSNRTQDNVPGLLHQYNQVFSVWRQDKNMKRPTAFFTEAAPQEKIQLTNITILEEDMERAIREIKPNVA